MIVTLKRLAKELNLSPATISLALRGSPGIAAKTRQLVCETAARYDYVPSNFGRALQMRRSRLIGFYMPQATYSFFDEVLSAAGSVCLKHDYNLLLGWAYWEGKKCIVQGRQFLEKEVDALVVSFMTQEIQKELSRFENKKRPIIYCNCSDEKGISIRNGGSVHTDDMLGGRLAVRALCKVGHRNLLCSATNIERLEGNRQEASLWGASIAEYQGSIPDICAYIRQHPEITGIVSYCDEEALNLYHPLQEMGLRIPQDISIIGYDGIPMGGMPQFKLSTIEQQRTMLGRRAIETAIQMIEHPEREPVSELLEPSVLMRESIAPPRSRK